MGDGGFVWLLERVLRRHYHTGQATSKGETALPACLFWPESLQKLS